MTALGAMLPFAPERRVYRFLEWYPWRWWGARCDALVRGLLAPCLGGLYLCFRGQAMLHRGVPLDKQYWLMALVVSVAANGAPHPRAGCCSLLASPHHPRAQPSCAAHFRAKCRRPAHLPHLPAVRAAVLHRVHVRLLPDARQAAAHPVEPAARVHIARVSGDCVQAPLRAACRVLACW